MHSHIEVARWMHATYLPIPFRFASLGTCSIASDAKFRDMNKIVGYTIKTKTTGESCAYSIGIHIVDWPYIYKINTWLHITNSPSGIHKSWCYHQWIIRSELLQFLPRTARSEAIFISNTEIKEGVVSYSLLFKQNKPAFRGISS